MDLIDDTVGKTPGDLLNYLILQRRSEALEALQKYMHRKFGAQGNPPTHDLRSKIVALFYDLQAALKRTKTKKVEGKEYTEYDAIRSQVMVDDDINVNIKALESMLEWLDDKKISRPDMHRTYERSRVEVENQFKGL